MTDAIRRTKPPTLEPGASNPGEWVLYLQQMLNWFYQMQVVPENGEYDHHTQHAVSHLRGQLHLEPVPVVDERVWKEIGDTEEQVKKFENGVEVNTEADEDTCWAGAISIASVANGTERTREDVLNAVGGPERRTAVDAKGIATGQFSQYAQRVYGDQPASWSEVLRKHGVAWLPNPANEQCALVVTGIKQEDEAVKIRVAKPCGNAQEWLEFTEFVSTYALPSDEIEIISAG